MTFSVFVPEGNDKLAGYGEFAIRFKAASNGYVDFNTGSGTLTTGSWQTYTVDLAPYGGALTEFAFIIPAGNTVYFKDITVQ